MPAIKTATNGLRAKPKAKSIHATYEIPDFLLDPPLTVGQRVELVSGKFAGQRGVVVSVVKNKPPMIETDSGYITTGAESQWMRVQEG